MNLSICTTIKNRSKVKTQHGTLNLFPNCVESLANTLHLNDNVELIIADWESTDWPINDWIEEKIPIPVEIINVKHIKKEFSIGKGRNIAASHATKDMLLFLDADMLIKDSNSLIEAYNIALEFGHCYPQVLYQKTYDKEHWEIHEGGGNLFIKRDIFQQVGGWPEYWGHGFEDTDFAKMIKQVTGDLITSEVPIFHQWHPQQFEWKNKYSSKDKAKKEQLIERKEYHQNKSNDDVQTIIDGIENTVKKSPLTNHSKKKVARGEDKRIL